jgi:Tfp pilus assembly protein PilF
MKKFLLYTILFLTIISCEDPKVKARAKVEKGIEILYQSRYQDAIIEFESAIKSDPVNFEAYHYLAASYANLGKYKDAIENYKKAIEINPKYANAYFNLGLIFEHNADRDSACFYFLKAEELGKPNMNDYTKHCK